MTPAEFEIPFKQLAMVFQLPDTKEGIAVWFNALSDLTAEQWKVGVDRAIREIKEGFIRPAHIRALVEPGLDFMADEIFARLMSLRKRSLEYWRECNQELNLIEYLATEGTLYLTPPEVKADPFLDRIVRQLRGWHIFCSNPTDDFTRKVIRDAVKDYGSNAHYKPMLPESAGHALPGNGRKALGEGGQ